MQFLKKRYALMGLLLLALVACNKDSVSSVTLDRNDLSLQVGEQYQLEVVVNPLSAAMNNSVSWESSDEAVASVASDGTVTAVYTGECVITAKAGGKSASCMVTVGKLDYDFEFDHATALYYGDAYEIGTNSLTLRLLGDGITLDDEGALVGEGLFFNIDMNVPLGQRTVPAHTFELDSSRAEYTFVAGQSETIDGTQYATGTFVGQRTAQGLTVVFVKSGAFWVKESGGTYTLEGRFEGQNQETIVVAFSGKIATIDRSGETPLATYNFATAALQQTVLTNTASGLNQFQFTATDADTTLIFTLYAPLSVTDKCPIGSYDFSGARAYSIASAAFKMGTSAFAVARGEVSVAESGDKQTISCRFVDETGRVVSGIFTDIRTD